MRNVNWPKPLKNLGTCLRRNDSKISIALGIGLGIATTITAVSQTPKALDLIEQRKEELEVEKLSPKETIRTVWPCYIWPAVTGALSVTCLVWSNVADSRKNAAIMAAYTMSEKAFSEYREKAVEKLGEKGSKAVEQAVIKEKIDKNQEPEGDKEIVVLDEGEYRCYDCFSGREFKSDRETIRKAVNDFDEIVRLDGHASLNDFYDILGLKPIDPGDYVGWNVSRGYLEVDFDSVLGSNGKPCLAMIFKTKPIPGFDEIYI